MAMNIFNIFRRRNEDEEDDETSDDIQIIVEDEEDATSEDEEDDSSEDEEDDSTEETEDNMPTMIPMQPAQKWLDENGWELVGFRLVEDGEIYIDEDLVMRICDDDTLSIDSDIWHGDRWVIRPRHLPSPVVSDAQAAAIAAPDVGHPPVPDNEKL